MEKSLMWFRRDLRLQDNPALFHAFKKENVIAFYITDHEFNSIHGVSMAQQNFILEGIELLKADLQKLNILFLSLEVEKTNDIPAVILNILSKEKISHLFFNKEYEVDEKIRDESVVHLAKENNISVMTFHDQTMFPPGTIKTGEGKMFKVFTAFKNAWLKHFNQFPFSLFEMPHPPTLSKKVYEKKTDWPAGEVEAHHRLEHFINTCLNVYEQVRDFPALDHTSKLSPYLTTGMISLRECFLKTYDHKSKGAETWRNELIWREFYKHILEATPRVSMNKPFLLITEKIKWDNDEIKLIAWKNGQTGIPIVDAAMRQLNQTGWMHNRLRMITAMFFTKNLWLDWRVGEAYFMSRLIDGDFAANNGGWQWCASTGTDAAPYFRIFNPVTQSERFDPEGNFIRAYCPELKDFNNKSIHAPYERAPLLAQASGYPAPIVNLKETRAHAIKAFSALMKFA